MEESDSAGTAPGFKDRMNQLYLSIILRYSSYIESKENLSVAELPTLVTPNSTAVSEISEQIKGDNYSYESSFYDASVRSLEFVKTEIDDVFLPVQFWILPDETLKFRLGDQVDKNILLCSILIKLGNPSTKVLIFIGEDSRKSYVYYEFNEGVYLLDLTDNIKLFKNKEEMFKGIGISEDTKSPIL
ncbi:MAG: hypothetical protein M1562_02420 [Candidatus Marsarchaeota archaeon]|nr:hypothetical protein [Candidatus Marsarchaeota archaeon]